jgi:hypothetical protein
MSNTALMLPNNLSHNVRATIEAAKTPLTEESIALHDVPSAQRPAPPCSGARGLLPWTYAEIGSNVSATTFLSPHQCVSAACSISQTRR